ncbi:MAG TPA: efflux RND transporter periplasmic adaptor subunit [Phycisphaerae bacterium]|nr:efflux RND transporter periplasmic adaptor subunit [Phycisphaerae bacterium]
MNRICVSLAAWALLTASGNCRKKDSPVPPPPAVTVARPVERTVIEWDEYTGYLDAVDFVEVRARVSGLIMYSHFQEGGIVKEGDLLVELDVRPFQADLDAKIAAEAQAAAQVDLAKVDFDRIEGIPKDSRSRTEYDTAAARLKEAEALLSAAKANVESARLNVEWCRVTAPIAGRISRKLVTEGNLITGGSGTGTLLTTIASIDPIYCYVDADERSVLKYQRMSREGTRTSARDAYIPCFLQLTDETNFPHEGYIDFVDNRIDPTTGTIQGRGVFKNPKGYLLPGFFGRIRIPGSGKYQAVLVPDEAIVADQDQRLVMTVGPDDVVQPRPVKLGALFGNLRAILSGVGASDRIIINGLMQARPGAKVSSHEAEISMTAFESASPDRPTTRVFYDDDATATTPAPTSTPSTGTAP